MGEENDAFEEKNFLDIRTEKAFENCIFMSSSKRDEPSEATQESSLFTDVFISAVLDGTKADVIRYSDIQNFITDEFIAKKYGQTPYFNLQCDGRAIFANTTAALKKLANEQIENEAVLPESRSELEANLDSFLNAYRTEEAVKEIVEKVREILTDEKLPLPWIDKYYDVNIGNRVKREFEEDNGIVKFLYGRCEKENLYVEFETERVRQENAFNMPFIGYKTVPVRFTSLVHTLPSYITISLLPKKDGLPKYQIDFVFVYSDTGMYVFHGVRQHICKGWSEFVVGDKKSYTYRWLEYAQFDKEDWKTYVQKRLEESTEFVEKSLNDYVVRG